MAALIDDLLDVSRVTRGLVSVESRDEDLRDIVADAVEQATPQVEAHRHALAVRTPDAPVRVAGDRKRLVQVLTNLLDNACKYTPDGGRIELALDGGATHARLAVRDDGMGVAAEMRERIFDLFVQGQRGADRAQGGLGIGLALARRLVELHCGTLTCASPGVGQGSEFEMRLPLAGLGAPAAPGPAASPAAAAGPRALCILVVDDNVDAAHMLAMLLEDAGHEVMTEADPLVALERAQATRPDVFLLDIGLPRIDGHELARRLRASPAGAGATLIALTGYGQDSDREQAIAAGFDHHMVKPPDPAALARLLRAVATRPR
jgi:CheY-like chemotaxis protein